MRRTEIVWVNIIRRVNNDPSIKVEGPLPESVGMRTRDKYNRERTDEEIKAGLLYQLDATDPPRGRPPKRGTPKRNSYAGRGR
jgi:hypothetical protein